MVVDNKSGAGMTIATDFGVCSTDGHTFGWVISSHTINPGCARCRTTR